MLIQCTACGAQAKIPDSKEGAKVRCPSCSHVFVARPPGGRAAKKADPTRYFVIGGVVVAAAIVVVIATQGTPEAKPVDTTEEARRPEPAQVDDMGWDSPAAKLARNVHGAAVAQDRTRLQAELDPEAAYEDWRERELAANAEAIEDALAANVDLAEGVPPVEVPATLSLPAWSEMPLVDRNVFVASVVDRMLADDEENLVRAWAPFEGHVASIDLDRAVVRLLVHRRENDDGQNRTIEWRLVDTRTEGAPEARWRVAGWSRYFTPEELAAARTKKHKKTVKRTLEDGSLVIEGEIRSIPYEDDVPQAERDRIDALIRDLIDLGARPAVRTAAQEKLVATGKPAIAPLLTVIANKVPIDDEDEAIQLGKVHSTLMEMTGYITTFKPHVALGTTEERKDSGLKQWFGWYDRKYKKYTGKPVVDEDDLMDDPMWKPRDERERREFERIRAAEGGG